MGELVERATGVVAAAAGNTVSGAVAALMTTAAIVTGNAELAVWSVPASALAGPLTEEGVLLVRRAWGDRAERVQEFADAVAEEAGAPIDAVLEEVSGDRRVRQLLGEAVAASVGAVDDWKIRTLAKAFVRGAQDGAVVDEMRMLVDVLRDVEVPEIRLLAIVNRKPRGSAGGWMHDEIRQADRGIAHVVHLLIRRLRTKGFSDGTTMIEHSTPIGAWCAKCLAELGSLPEPVDH